MTREIYNHEDIIDSRDVIERIADLEEFLAADSVNEEDYPAEQEELKALKKLAEEGEASPDWHFGEALIRDDYFEEYAQDLARDLGAIQADQGWPNNCIDWEQAAEELRVDYISVDFDGVTYWIRG